MSKFRLAKASAVLNLLGAFLVFLSFQATSTKFLLVTAPDGSSSLCVADRALFAIDAGGALVMGVKCPTGPDTKPTAVVNTDSPGLGYFGWFLLASGFITQFFSIEESMKLSREDLATIRKARRIIEDMGQWPVDRD